MKMKEKAGAMKKLVIFFQLLRQIHWNKNCWI